MRMEIGDSGHSNPRTALKTSTNPHQENGLANLLDCQPSSVLFTVVVRKLGCNGERTVRNCHCIIADPAGCISQSGDNSVRSRCAADRCLAVLGCANGITVLDPCDRSGEGGVGLACGARRVISNNAQRRWCNRECAGVDDHVVTAQLVVWVNQGSNN